MQYVALSRLTLVTKQSLYMSLVVGTRSFRNFFSVSLHLWHLVGMLLIYFPSTYFLSFFWEPKANLTFKDWKTWPFLIVFRSWYTNMYQRCSRWWKLTVNEQYYIFVLALQNSPVNKVIINVSDRNTVTSFSTSAILQVYADMNFAINKWCLLKNGFSLHY